MAVTIENQNIGKRYKSSSAGHNNKSAGFNTGFMSQFDQRPVRKRKKSPHSGSSPSFFNMIGQRNKINERRSAYQTSYRRGSSSDARYRKQEQPQNNNNNSNEKNNSNSGSGFSFAVPSVATLLVIAGTIFISLVALKWDDLNIQIPQNYVFQPAAGDNTEERARKYASTGIVNVLQPHNTAVKPDSLTNPADSIVTGTAPEATHNTETEFLVTFQWQPYNVKKGDTVSGIAQRHSVSVGAVIASNDIKNARRLQEGAVLRIPNIDGIPYTIKRGDNLSGIAASFKVPLDVILDVNDIKSDIIKAGEMIFIPGARMNDMDLRLSMGDLFIYPLQTRYITSNFGLRKDPINGHLAYHNGIDLRGSTGTTVMAALDGTVSVVSENWLYGKYIIITHTNGYKTLYAHLSSTSVRQGDRVVTGRKIGEVGNTGYSTGSHLHFGIYNKEGKEVNPLDLLH
ncbi:MAG: peptidoglycan DD-metalloendopeptidase family protein [Treponema sp.]|nr:peptidoglycan DD-metalloendopeptidase family protein [Treponema sp.]